MFGPCPMESALTAGHHLIDAAAMDAEGSGSRDRRSVRRGHFGLAGNAPAPSGRPASGPRGARGCPGPDHGGTGRARRAGSPRTGGPLSLSGLPGRRLSPPRSRLPDRAGPCPASPGPPGGRGTRSRPGEGRSRRTACPRVEGETAGRPAGRASPPPARASVAAPVGGGRPASGRRAPVLRAGVRPASASG